MHLTSPRSAFHATRLTHNTFVLKEYNDIFDEHPLIYVKRIPSTQVIVVIDTGCGGASKDEDVKISSLRMFIESVPLATNDGLPLNKEKWPYIVICTHVHYDHILGVENFAHDSRILGSSNDPGFLSPHLRPLHSLCEELGIRTPEYTLTLVPHMHGVAHNGLQTGLTIFHTPGHTPDELAVWDVQDGVLYVGDTLYEWGTIIFPGEGSLVNWWRSVHDLIRLVELFNASSSAQASGSKVRIAAGHVTSGKEDAWDVLTAARDFIQNVIQGREKVRRREEKRGETYGLYMREDSRYSLSIPERLVEEARRHLDM